MIRKRRFYKDSFLVLRFRLLNSEIGNDLYREKQGRNDDQERFRLLNSEIGNDRYNTKE